MIFKRPVIFKTYEYRPEKLEDGTVMPVPIPSIMIMISFMMYA